MARLDVDVSEACRLGRAPSPATLPVLEAVTEVEEATGLDEIAEPVLVTGLDVGDASVAELIADVDTEAGGTIAGEA